MLPYGEYLELGNSVSIKKVMLEDVEIAWEMVGKERRLLSAKVREVVVDPKRVLTTNTYLPLPKAYNGKDKVAFASHDSIEIVNLDGTPIGYVPGTPILFSFIDYDKLGAFIVDYDGEIYWATYQVKGTVKQLKKVNVASCVTVEVLEMYFDISTNNAYAKLYDRWLSQREGKEALIGGNEDIVIIVKNNNSNTTPKLIVFEFDKCKSSEALKVHNVISIRPLVNFNVDHAVVYLIEKESDKPLYNVWWLVLHDIRSGLVVPLITGAGMSGILPPIEWSKNSLKVLVTTFRKEFEVEFKIRSLEELYRAYKNNFVNILLPSVSALPTLISLSDVYRDKSELVSLLNAYGMIDRKVPTAKAQKVLIGNLTGSAHSIVSWGNWGYVIQERPEIWRLESFSGRTVDVKGIGIAILPRNLSFYVINEDWLDLYVNGYPWTSISIPAPIVGWSVVDDVLFVSTLEDENVVVYAFDSVGKLVESWSQRLPREVIEKTKDNPDAFIHNYYTIPKDGFVVILPSMGQTLYPLSPSRVLYVLTKGYHVKLWLYANEYATPLLDNTNVIKLYSNNILYVIKRDNVKARKYMFDVQYSLPSGVVLSYEDALFVDRGNSLLLIEKDVRTHSFMLGMFMNSNDILQNLYPYSKIIADDIVLYEKDEGRWEAWRII